MDDIIPKPILQLGITGIKAETVTDLLLSKADVDQLTQCCYLAARNYGTQFLGFRGSGSYNENFYLMWFQHKYVQTKRILGMVNIYYLHVAFIEIDLKGMSLGKDGLPNRISFGGSSFQRYPIFEDSSLTYWFEQSGYRLLKQSELLETLKFSFISNSEGKNRNDKKPTILLKNYHNLRQKDIEDIYHHHQRGLAKIVADVVFGSYD
ncbi:MAG: hypothetical protein AAF490_27225 [Chloroflexota bacterium]